MKGILGDRDIIRLKLRRLYTAYTREGLVDQQRSGSKAVQSAWCASAPPASWPGFTINCGLVSHHKPTFAIVWRFNIARNKGRCGKVAGGGWPQLRNTVDGCTSGMQQQAGCYRCAGLSLDFLLTLRSEIINRLFLLSRNHITNN